MNEGFLGKYTFGGERAATDDHPTVIHYLPLAASVSEKLDVGLLLKAVDVYGATAVVGAENTGVTAASVTLETLAAKVREVRADVGLALCLCVHLRQRVEAGRQPGHHHGIRSVPDR